MSSKGSSSGAPTLKMGWLKKQSRTGMIRNWKQRFVVLEAGLLRYYEKKLAQDIPPYGDVEKGDLSLKSASLTFKRDGSNRIFIECSEKQADILLESDSAAEAVSWASAINEHIIYANANHSGRALFSRTSVLESSDSVGVSSSSRTKSVYIKDENSRSKSIFFKDDSDKSDGIEGAEAGFSVQPTPGFVIKTKSRGAEKVFINVCEHGSIPTVSTSIGTLKTNLKWPSMITSPGRTFKDDEKGKSDASTVYDVVVHPSVLQLCHNDESLSTRDLLCSRIIKLMRTKYDSNIDLEYKLPKVPKGFKGSIEPVYLDVQLKKSSDGILNLLTGKGRKSAYVASEDFRANTTDLTETSESSPVRRKTLSGKLSISAVRQKSQTSISSALTDATEDTDYSSAAGNSRQNSLNPALARSVSESLAPARHSSATVALTTKDSALAASALSRFRLGGAGRALADAAHTAFNASPIGRFIAAVNEVMKAKKYVPYVVIKQGGVMCRPKPSKDGGVSKMVPCNERVMVYARKRINEINWLKCKDGWVQETMAPFGEKLIVPVSQIKQPIGAEILSTRIVEVQPEAKKGWFYDGPKPDSTYSLRFVIDILGPEDTKVKIHRSYDEIINLRKALLAASDKSIVARVQKLAFPTNSEGDLDLLCYTTYLVDFVDTLGTWLREVVRFVNLERCKVKEYKRFMTPNEEDFNAIEIDLAAEGGMGGAFEDDPSVVAPELGY